MRPFALWPVELLRKIYWISFAATAFVGITLILHGNQLKSPQAPLGIISIELSYSGDALLSMYQQYQGKLEAALGFSLGFDCLFIPCYSTTIAAGLVLQRRGKNLAVSPFIYGLAASQWLAGACDAAENTALLCALMTGVTHSLAMTASLFATVKFAIIAVSLGALLAGLRLRKSQ